VSLSVLKNKVDFATVCCMVQQRHLVVDVSLAPATRQDQAAVLEPISVTCCRPATTSKEMSRMGCHGSRAAEAGVDIKKELSLGGATSCCACVHSIFGNCILHGQQLELEEKYMGKRRKVHGEIQREVQQPTIGLLVLCAGELVHLCRRRGLWGRKVATAQADRWSRRQGRGL
jgi:hypothetical protein